MSKFKTSRELKLAVKNRIENGNLVDRDHAKHLIGLMQELHFLTLMYPEDRFWIEKENENQKQIEIHGGYLALARIVYGSEAVDGFQKTSEV